MTELIQDSPEAFLLVDDSVQDKRYSQFIELVKLQYSGAEHGLVRGIGIINLMHSAGHKKDFGSCVKEVRGSDKLWAWNFQSQNCLTMKIALNGYSSIFIPKDNSVLSATVR